MKLITRQLSRRRRSRRGMTLIEIIVVITILSLLMAAVGVAVIPQLEKAKVDRARNMDIPVLQDALKSYYLRKGKFPDTGGGLQALVDQQIIEKAPLDPWDHEYIYILEGGKPVIMSYGRDGAPGGEDSDADISSKDTGTKK